MRIFCFLVLLASVSVVRAESFSADILENSPSKKLLFKFTRAEKDHHVVRTYVDPQGVRAALEELDYDGDVLKKATLVQDQLGQKGSITVSNGRINFEYTKDGVTKKANLELESNFIVTDQVYPFVLKNWGALMKGDSLTVRLGVMDRLETVGFKFFKENDETVDGKPMTIIKMKPTSFLIATVVHPILFYFEKDDAHRLDKVVGRTLPKIKTSGGKWADLEAILKFYPLAVSEKKESTDH